MSCNLDFSLPFFSLLLELGFWFCLGVNTFETHADVIDCVDIVGPVFVCRRVVPVVVPLVVTVVVGGAVTVVGGITGQCTVLIGIDGVFTLVVGGGAWVKYIKTVSNI